MRRLKPVGVLLVLPVVCACSAPIREAMNHAPAPERIILAGSLEMIPPIPPVNDPCLGGLGYPSMKGKAFLMLANHLHPLERGITRFYVNADWAKVPLEGAFFIELPTGRGEWYVRGLAAPGPNGFYLTPFDALLPVPEGAAGVVYVGHLRMQRQQPRQLFVYDLPNEQRAAAEEQGLERLLGLPWTTALAEFVER